VNPALWDHLRPKRGNKDAKAAHWGKKVAMALQAKRRRSWLVSDVRVERIAIKAARQPALSARIKNSPAQTKTGAKTSTSVHILISGTIAPFTPRARTRALMGDLIANTVTSADVTMDTL